MKIQIKKILRFITIKQLGWYNLFCLWGYENIAKELEEEEEIFLDNRYYYIEREKESRKDYRKKQLELEKELGETVCNDMSKAYLNNRLKVIDKNIAYAYDHMNKQRRSHVPFWWRQAFLNSFYAVPKLEIEKKKIEHKLNYLNSDTTNLKRFTPEQIRQAEERNPEDFIDFNYAGFCICPFHEEKTPSMKYYTDTFRFHCYGCGWHGNLIDFIMQRDNIGFVELKYI